MHAEGKKGSQPNAGASFLAKAKGRPKPVRQTNADGKMICRFFESGNCKLGEKCDFVHQSAEPAMVCTEMKDGESNMPPAAVAKWIIDTGAAHHLVNSGSAIGSVQRPAPTLHMATANGAVASKAVVDIQLDGLQGMCMEGRVLDNTPNVLSIGRLVSEKGYSFRWEASDPEGPTLVSPSGQITLLTVVNFVPVIAAPVIEQPAVEEVDEVANVVGDSQMGLTKAEWLMHKMHHLPKNPMCKACVMGKTFAKPARANEGGADSLLPEVTDFGEYVMADHLFAKMDDLDQHNAIGVALVVKDHATRYIAAYPAKDRSMETCSESLKHFKGIDKVHQIYSDNAAELAAMARAVGAVPAMSTPWRHQSNAIIERSIGTLQQLAGPFSGKVAYPCGIGTML